MERALSGNSFRAVDALYLTALLIFLGFLLFFSALFYLATEDYEAVVAVRLIEQGSLVGKSTGWPYAPLAPYLFYVHSIFLDSTILGLRILTAFFVLASVFPIYLIIRNFCSAFMSFALTLFSFSLSTFPHPRLEYYIEGSLASVAMLFAVKFLRQSRKRHLYISALFSLAAFSSRGYPNSAILLFLIPLALVGVQAIIEETFILRKYFRYYRIVLKVRFRDFKAYVLRKSQLKPLGFVFLGLLCMGLLLRFLRKLVYGRALIEYADINDLVNFPSKLLKSSLSWLLLFIFVGTYLALTSRWRVLKRIYPIVYPIGWRVLKRIYPIMFPFVLFSFLFGLVGALIGYDFDDLLFFVFPLDIFIDHVRQIGSKASVVIPLFFILVATILYLYLTKSLSAQKAQLSLFLLFLLPCTFTRFFPGYNMLYLGSFVVAIFVSIILTKLAELLFRMEVSIKLQKSIGIFLIVYSVGSNMFLLVRTQWNDLQKGGLVKMDQGAIGGIFVENDVVDYFGEVDGILEGMNAKEQNIAFLSNRYLKYVPLIYGYNDVLAGQNLMSGLGRLWSYDDILKVEGVKSNNRLGWANMVYSWREAAVEKMEGSNTAIIVVSFYDSGITTDTLNPSLDPFREYLRKNFILADVVEPNMEMHRRSSFSEGAVIFVRKGWSVG